ncbi:MAG: dihydroxyacetone kinase subunit L [Candidatus Roseilinea sp.]|nr:MAG: dihydroxyacetone kinase subunit L [Candidatus Roseilinea sp.]
MTITREHILKWLDAYAHAVNAHADELNRLDAMLGDGDFGASMQRGLGAVQSKMPSMAEQDIGAIFKIVGMILVNTMGGTSGPLLGTLFIQMGGKTQGKTELSLRDWTEALQAGVDGVMARGKAQVGDKTMLDAFVPAVEALQAAVAQGVPVVAALQRAADAAKFGRDETARLIARKGRASYVGERGVGSIDPGAANAYLFVQAMASVVGVE